MQVAGTTWMDHEFGTSFLGADQEGWDWLSLNFDDGSSLMVFRIRASGGATPGYSGGTYVAPDGRAVALQDSSMEPVEDWTTPDGTTTYPVRWRVTVPSVQLDLEVWAVVPDQEVRARATVGFSYWEGLVHSSGESGVTPVTGVGYLELTGYAGQPMGTVFGL
jgi:predicted secreted hydrolase